jgi:hypothetical protein
MKKGSTSYEKLAKIFQLEIGKFSDGELLKMLPKFGTDQKDINIFGSVAFAELLKRQKADGNPRILKDIISRHTPVVNLAIEEYLKTKPTASDLFDLCRKEEYSHDELMLLIPQDPFFQGLSTDMLVELVSHYPENEKHHEGYQRMAKKVISFDLSARQWKKVLWGFLVTARISTHVFFHEIRKFDYCLLKKALAKIDGQDTMPAGLQKWINAEIEHWLKGYSVE